MNRFAEQARWRMAGALLLVMVLLLVGMDKPAAAASAKSKFYAADRCYQRLRHSVTKQKYRDQWLKCINGYMAVYRHDPGGPWAAAGLFNAGKLYAELYRRSYLGSDRKEAIDLFTRVSRRYPKSRYRSKAVAALKAIETPVKAKKPTSTVATARQWYKRGQSAYHRLLKKPSQQKYRAPWLKSIDAYQRAYRMEPEGPLAAAALYEAGRLYTELYKRSFKPGDKTAAHRLLNDVISQFAQSPYAQKARLLLGDEAVAATPPGDALGQMLGAEGQAQLGDSAPPPSASNGRPAIIQGLRFWSNPRYTRVVIDADRDTTFAYRELKKDPSIGKPRRIYIDVANSRLGSNLQKMIPIDDNLLSDARAGQYSADTVRVVVDIKSSKTFKIFSLKNPYRIVLDVWGVEVKTASTQPPLPSVRPSSQKLPASAIAKQLALGVRRIVIDPGHGGKDYGAPGAIKGVHEKNVVLQIAKRLARKVRQQLKVDVKMTRTTDTYLTLEERTAMANTWDADLFISIHTNASRDRRAYGIETFILNLATDDESIRVAARENMTSTRNISDLDSILHDLMQNAKVNESSRLAGHVQQALYTQLRPKYRNIKSKGVKQAPFYVLLGAEMPAILVETSFISNKRECRRLTNPRYQEYLCDAIIKGLRRYIKETNPMAFAPSSPASKTNG